MPFIKIWVHCVWATKNRSVMLSREVRSSLFDHMIEHARNNGLFIDSINGSNDHIHLLISMGSDQNISKVVQQLKGESAFWLNRNGMLPFRFEWQKDYFAVSVSESQADNVRNYINGQTEHHRVKSFADEYKEFIEKFGFREVDGRTDGMNTE
ncbi:MAG: IS200/IS605 family transposase [Chlorobiaceae bacterium]|nr:IS200/IS605 family transposase [Chlorobiaceae bacterium]